MFIKKNCSLATSHNIPHQPLVVDGLVSFPKIILRYYNYA
jgi:hypothetical protein